ncbi:TonB-dependent receptor domain-containing protein [Flavivirga spongiicola]|uniref:TonB-dependent receptor n=1 Tax=Flavivirga spongiicola TaxID=421621 RepID=A0ABU7XY58_9FLAO|nr:outer membrane beta-barrel family protein [Flavivirga sp. MEBiC05379]MDO5980507.1 outer membrane beta-barrel family protein [Flavivirga sp. MEBiC05379]
MIKNLFYHFILLLSLSSFSQEYRLNGYVKDDNNNPIAHSNILITSLGGSKIANGTSTDEKGYFIIENLKAGDYILKIRFLGFKTYSTRVELDRNIHFDTIILEENLETLDGITVVAKRPTVNRMVDRLVFNVENSTLSNDNVLDVLKHTPGVLVHDGTITVKQSTPTVYINDRRVHLSSSEVQQLLEGTSATNVKSIEVITNPPAKYEAEGGAVLNIVTNRNIIAGYNGSVFGNYRQGSEFPKYSFGTSHFFKAKKLNTYINYSISPRKDFQHNNEFINFLNDNNQNTSSWETDYKRTRETSNQNINANIDYDINDRNSLGFSTSMLITPRDHTNTFVNSLTEVFNANKTLDSTFNTLNRKVDETFNLAFTLDYVHKFKKEGEKLSISTHHTNYDFSSFQNVDTDYRFPDNILIRSNRFQTFSSQVIKLYTGQLDYELPINGSAQFEAGGKVSNINSESILNQFIFENDIKIEDLQNSDTFLYDEINYAAYISYSKDWERWSFKSGLRVEHTDIKGNSLSTSQNSNNDYLKLFPSLHLLHKLNDNNELYFNYNKRIHRPRYNELNPFKYFLNDNVYITGDPNLKPQIDDTFTLGYTLKKDYAFELYYRYETDPTIRIIFQDNDNNKLTYVDTNINRSISYGLDFTTYKKLANNWNLYVLSSLFYYEEEFFALKSSNALLVNNRWSIFGQIINYYSFLKDHSLTADISYLYISPIVNGPTDASARSGIDISIKKTFWNKKATLSIGATDIFNTQNFKTITQYLNQDVFLKSRRENRLLTFGFNYKFGNFRLRTNKKEIDLNERERFKENTN